MTSTREPRASASPSAPDPSDISLLTAWREGDADSGDQLLRRHMNAVRSFVQRRIPAATDDLLQATLMIAAQRKDDFRGSGSYRSYLLGVARYQVSRHHRTRQRDRLVLTGFADDCPDARGTSAREALELARRSHQLRRALGGIPPELRTTVLMHYWSGLTTGQVAAALDIPRGTAKSRLRRAREALYVRLQPGAEHRTTGGLR